MSIGLEGQNLIFLISQPRAGSTMAQRILGCHPDIHTLSEPWLMLHPIYGLRYGGYDAEYNASWARAITKEFFQKIPNHEETYFQGLRQMYSYIYNTALSSSEKSYFLDKTPRYYLIISELKQAFPEAHFIILLRNPLAVFVSIITTWINKEWSNLENFKHDLIKAPQCLVEGISNLGKNCKIIHYEKSIAQPREEIKRICQAMGLEFFPEMIEYGLNNSVKWKFGDQKLVYQKTRPDPQNLDKWILSLENPQIWQAADDYLKFLGHEIVYQMGYSYRELRKTLDTNRPKEVDWAKISRVEWLQGKPEHYREAPQTSLGYAVMARKNERKGKLVEATAAYQKALELNPKSAWSYFNLGEALSKLQKWDEAIAAYQEAIKLNSSSASFYYNLADAFMKKNNLDEAIANYSKAIEIKPSFSIGHNSLGEAFAKQGKFAEAVGCFRRAVELNSNYFRAYSNLAELLAEKGQLEEAVGFCQEAIKINPSYQITNCQLRDAVK
jgi:tetratricopeptide (TPR) repeat protein